MSIVYVIVDYRLIDHAVYGHGITDRPAARRWLLPHTKRCHLCGWSV